MDIKKQPLISASHSEFTLEALRQIAPSAFTEVRGADGELTHKVNFDVLRELLGDAIADADEETFGFQWVGKQAAKRAAAEPTRRTLRPVVDDSVDWDTTENLYIEGDNLEVLKLLQRAYLGKVKMIYIDPPYNTGNDFVYDDDFAMSREEMDEALGNIDEEGNRLRRNLDSNPRYHSDWCSMMYSRLLVARTLLANDGVIFISIDDNEVHHLRKICDEVFGAGNFVAELVLVANIAGRSDSKHVAKSHEYCLMYQKTEAYVSGGLPLSKEQMAEYKYSDKYGSYRIQGLRKRGTNSRREDRPNLFYPIYFVEETGAISLEPMSNSIEIIPKLSDGSEGNWRWSKSTLEEKKENLEVRLVSIRNEYDVFEKVHLNQSEGDKTTKLKSFLLHAKYTTDAATTKYRGIMETKTFDSPKSVNFLVDLLRIGADESSLILDFFSGSATTAHAVMQLNAEDGGKRKYIMVQIPEETPQGSEARKAGYNTICDIGKERIRRAGAEIRRKMLGDRELPLTSNDSSLTSKLDTGFRVLRVDSSNMEDVYFGPAATTQENLFVETVKSDRSELDLLFGCMVDWGVELSYPLRKEEVAGKHLHIVNEGALVACFDKDINLEVIGYIAAMKPLRVILRESCFEKDADKLNVYEQFKQLCGWSDDEAYRRIHVI